MPVMLPGSVCRLELRVRKEKVSGNKAVFATYEVLAPLLPSCMGRESRKSEEWYLEVMCKLLNF